MVWERLSHHEIKVVFAHRRLPGGCAARSVRSGRRRRARLECSGVWLDATGDDSGPDDVRPEDFWPHDIWPGDIWPHDVRPDDG